MYYTYIHPYGVATIRRLPKTIGLFCRISSLLQGSFAQEIYNLKEPTNRRHPISEYMLDGRGNPGSEIFKRDVLYIYLLLPELMLDGTGWRRPIGCLKLQIIFRKRATNYRALSWKISCKDEASHGSSPPCRGNISSIYSDKGEGGGEKKKKKKKKMNSRDITSKKNNKSGIIKK